MLHGGFGMFWWLGGSCVRRHLNGLFATVCPHKRFGLLVMSSGPPPFFVSVGSCGYIMWMWVAASVTEYDMWMSYCFAFPSGPIFLVHDDLGQPPWQLPMSLTVIGTNKS